MKLELLAAVAVAGSGCPRADAFVPVPSAASVGGLTSTTRLMSAISTRPDGQGPAGDGASRRRRRRNAASYLSMKSQATPVKTDVSYTPMAGLPDYVVLSMEPSRTFTTSSAFVPLQVDVREGNTLVQLWAFPPPLYGTP